MPAWLLTLTLALLLAAPAVAQGAPTPPAAGRPAPAPAAAVDAQARKVKALEGQVATAEAEHGRREQAYQAKAAQVAKLKASRRSWNRDRQLRDLLAESKAMADELEAGQRKLTKLRADLTAARRAYLAAIDAELADTALISSRRVTLMRLRATVAAQLPRTRKKVSVAEVSVDPLDDPEDLEYKAQLLSESEQELEREARRMETRSQYFRRLARLERGKQRSQELEVFGDGPRRQSVRSDVRGSGTSAETDDDAGFEGPVGAPAQGDSAGEGNGAADPAPIDNGSTGGGTPPLSPPPADVRDESGLELTRVYADVVEPGTLDALRQADRTGTPGAKADAADRAATDLRGRAQRLRRQKAEMLDRARKLRSE